MTTKARRKNKKKKDGFERRMETEVALALVGILVRTVVVRQVGGQ